MIASWKDSFSPADRVKASEGARRAAGAALTGRLNARSHKRTMGRHAIWRYEAAFRPCYSAAGGFTGVSAVPGLAVSRAGAAWASLAAGLGSLGTAATEPYFSTSSARVS